MSFIEKLPWYDDYALLLEGRRIAEKGIEDLENPERQLLRVKKFYSNLGADYTKNKWILQVEKDISASNSGEDSRLNQLRREVRIGSIVEDAVLRQDDDSIRALIAYKDNELYTKLIRDIMFYIGVSKVKTDPSFINKVYNELRKKYTFEKVSLFIDEGVTYYIYYFQCLQTLLKKNKYRDAYDSIYELVKERCLNARLMFNSYLSDIYLADYINQILAEILAVDELLNETSESAEE